jgi:hypothetical protein
MIRRGFWLTAGAVTGIWGYRRVAAAGRRLSASLTPGGTLKLADPGTRARLASGQARRGAVALARETYHFTRDVREGMELYMARHQAPAGSTLSTDRTLSTDQTPSTDGALSVDRTHAHHHDARTEDGH